MGKIILSVGTIVRLNANLCTKYGLTNGAKGEVKHIIYNEDKAPPDLPLAIMVHCHYRGPCYPWPVDEDEKVVPICPVKREWMSNSRPCSRTMLPVILGNAFSIHNLQGSTCDRVILNPEEKEFSCGLMLDTTPGKSFMCFYLQASLSCAFIFRPRALRLRKEEDMRLEELERDTILEYQDVIARCCQLYNRNIH